MRGFVVTGLALCLLAPLAATAGGVNLAWSNCASEGGTSNLAFACDTNAGQSVLVSSFVPEADLGGVTGIESVLDFLVGDGVSPVPAWWDLAPTTGCRFAGGTLSANSTVDPANSTCVNWATNNEAGGVAAYQSNGDNFPPASAAAHRRLILGFAVPQPDSASVLVDHEYFAFNTVFKNLHTVGTGSCSGCSEPVCFVLQSINVVAGAIASQYLSHGVAAGSNFATWQGTGPDCRLVPTRRRTWSAVKDLYR